MIEDRIVLDLFAGTGALAFEALSRGARSAVLVDLDRATVRAISKAAADLGLADRVQALGIDLCRDPSTAAAEIVARTRAVPFDLVFADPPYAYVDIVPELVEALAGRDALASDAVIALEHAFRQPPARGTGWLAQPTTYRYGDTAVLLGTIPARTKARP